MTYKSDCILWRVVLAVFNLAVVERNYKSCGFSKSCNPSMIAEIQCSEYIPVRSVSLLYNSFGQEKFKTDEK